ncbi:MAG: hypothetical protein IJA52_00720 [Clostridia bacterium]|nr:hypothetical protein [Clostridia bacterium]
MNNNFDPNQQPQYEQAPQAPVYQQPLYEKPALNPTPFFIMAIIGLALSLEVSIVGIILSAIALSKAKAYFAQGGAYEGKAKAGKILATVGLWASIAGTVFWIIFIIIYSVIMALALAGGGADYSNMPDYFF